MDFIKRLILFAGAVALSFMTACSGGLFEAYLPTPVIASSSPSGSAVPALPNKTQNELFGVAWDSTKTLNPILSANKYNRELAPLLYEGLFALNSGFEPERVLCESYYAQENAWRFKLREGILFHDGSELTAKDAVYSIGLALTEESPYFSRLKKVVSVTAADKYSLEIKLSSPVARLPALLDIPIIKKDSGKSTFPSGTGPYMPKTEGNDIYLRAYAGWWQKKTLPQSRIQLIEGKDAETLIYNFESNIVSLLNVDPTGTSTLGLRGDCEGWDYPTTAMQYLGFNTRRAPFDNAKVRRAVGYAVDRGAVVSSVMLGKAVQSALPVPPQSKLYDSALNAQLSFDLSKLSSLMLEAGIEDADNDGLLDYKSKRGRAPMEFTLIVCSENSYKTAAAKYIAGTLEGVGVSVKVEELKWNDYLKALQAGDFDIYYGETVMSCDFSPEYLVRSQGSLNYGGYSDSTTNSLLDAFILSGSPDSAKALYSDIAQKAPIVPILFKSYSVYTHRGQIRGIKPYQNNLFSNFTDWVINN